MNCMKCGREIGEDQAFCDICLAEMENYPVNPGIAIHIPPHTEEEEPKRAPARRKPVLSPSEQVLRLKKKLLRTRVALAVVLLLCGGLCFLIRWIAGEMDFRPVLGQNYSTAETVDATKP